MTLPCNPQEYMKWRLQNPTASFLCYSWNYFPYNTIDSNITKIGFYRYIEKNIDWLLDLDLIRFISNDTITDGSTAITNIAKHSCLTTSK